MADTHDTCIVPACERVATRKAKRMCEMHYYRERRRGTTDYVGQQVIQGNLTHSGGYVLAAAPGHPMARGGYRAYEHRAVYYNTHGAGPFRCNWCGDPVTWLDMHVDHVDGNKENNDPANLVASCPVCNQQRGHDKMMLTLRARSGLTVHGVTRTLNEWAAYAEITRSAIRGRLANGWSPERAVLEPRGKRGPRRASV